MQRLVCRSMVSVFVLLPVALAGLALPASAINLELSSSSLSFIAVTGRSPAAQTFFAYATSSVPGFAPTVLATTQSGGNWLAVSTSVGGSFPSSVNVQVSVNSTSLSVGSYSGQVTVTQSGLAGSPATVAVSLRVIPAAPYILAEPEAIRLAAVAGLDPAPAGLSVRNAGTGTLNPMFTASASSGGNWLTLSAPIGGSFNNSSSVTVQARSASLAPATYTGTVTVTSAGASNSPLNVPVTLTVGGATGPVISVSPASLSFTAGLGANPTGRTLNINNAGIGTLRSAVTSSTSDGGRWLLISSPLGGSFSGSSSVLVNIDITGLTKATYSGTITVTDASAINSPVRVPITLIVDDPKPVMRLSRNSIAVALPVGANRALQFLEVSNVGTGLLKWSAVATSQGPTQWLSITPVSGEAVSSTIRMVLDATSLPMGVYNGEIVVTAERVFSGPSVQRVAVILGVGVSLPIINDHGIVNGASFLQASVAAGSIVSIFGRVLGPTQGVAAQLVGGLLPTELAGVRVLFGDAAAPLYFVSERQINVQVPLEAAGQESVPVQVIFNGLPSQAAPLNLRPADPGVFLVNGNPAIVFNSTNQLVSPAVPARAGDFLVIYATGLGALDTPIASGTPAPLTTLIRTRTLPRVTLGDLPVTVLFSGLAPGFVGLYQVNIQVPANVPSGNNALILSVDNAQTAPLTVPVR